MYNIAGAELVINQYYNPRKKAPDAMLQQQL
jgi:hypothetical protein